MIIDTKLKGKEEQLKGQDGNGKSGREYPQKRIEE